MEKGQLLQIVERFEAAALLLQSKGANLYGKLGLKEKTKNNRTRTGGFVFFILPFANILLYSFFFDPPPHICIYMLLLC